MRNGVDTTAIDTAIAAANAAKADVVISTDGSDVAPGTNWVTQDVNDALATAITTATEAKSTVSDAGEVTTAAEALDAAVVIYEAAKADGTQADSVDTTAIDTAIAAANAAKADVVISTDGSDVAPGTNWVTQDVNDALATAITTATEAKSTVSDAGEVTTAAEALDAAVVIYEAAKADGTQADSVDTTAIDTAIAAANAAKADVVISTDGSDVAPGTNWVTQDVNDALATAITTATEAKSTVSDAGEVTTAAEALDAAVVIYEAAKADGTKEA